MKTFDSPDDGLYPSERLRRLREARGLSLQQFADAVGLSKSHLWEIEQGRTPIDGMSYRNCCAVAAALGISVINLMRMP
jgi:transcriptional regulator with XRE-family HTH domain